MTEPRLPSPGTSAILGHRSDRRTDARLACSALPIAVIGIGARMPTVYFELSKGLTNLCPPGPVPLTCRTVSSSISMKCGTLAGSV